MASYSHFYFAWCDEENGFDGSMLREDEMIFSFDLKHDEGQFATLELEIVNPMVGLLSPGRPLWAWFSWYDGSAVHPLFFGRLIGIPDDLFKTIVKIKLLAKSSDYSSQQTALADSLRYLPYYDPVFFDPTKAADPNTALEGRSALWHVDRLTHAVTISDIISGEDGTVEFTQNDAFYDDVSMKIAKPPLLLCEIEAQASWTQCDHTGIFPVKSVTNLGAVTSTKGNTGTVSAPSFQTDPYQAQADQASQQADQKAIQAQNKEAAKQAEINATPPTQTTYSWNYKNVSPGPHQDGDLMEESGSITIPYYGGERTKKNEKKQNADKESGQGEEYSISETYKYTYDYQPPTPQPGPSPPSPPNNMHSWMPLPGYQPGSGGDTTGLATTPTPIASELQQSRTEAVYVAMLADVQPVLADVADTGGAPSASPNQKSTTIQSLTMNTQDVVGAGAATASDGIYFASARGQQSIEYLLMVARAHLLAGSRVVEVSWKSRMSKVVGLSCRMSAAIDDPRLPGGQAWGKIVSYEMTGNGDAGEFLGAVTINCAVGNGGSPVGRSGTGATPGTPVYVNPGYVNGYQFYEGAMVNAVTNDVAYSPLQFQAVGIQLPISQEQILLRHEYYDGAANGEISRTIQMAAQQLRDFTIGPIGQPITSPPPEALAYSKLEMQADQIITQVIQDNPSWVEMEFAPTVGISVSASYTLKVGPLTVPKQINLS